MQFSNEELEKKLIQKFIDISGVEIKRLSKDGELLNKDSNEPIETICFDGDKENIFVNFLGIETDIFVFDEEIMLIDESVKNVYTSSDVCHNVIFEGELRKLNHDEILQLIADIIMCFINATGLNVTENPVPKSKFYKNYKYYSPLCYTIDVKNDAINIRKKIFENIEINF
ncbi:MAG: hypothetical protein HFE57_10040 [Firmicutes bacterium]|nr:hypothetical protein [Bacillota bacterium]